MKHLRQTTFIKKKKDPSVTTHAYESPALGRLKQVDHKFEAILVYIDKPC
jgi:hypothetical protein